MFRSVGGFRGGPPGRGWVQGGGGRRPTARSRSCGQTPPVEPAPSLHFVGHVGEHDVGAGARQADGSDDEAHRSLLVGEGVLHQSAYQQTLSRWHARCAGAIGFPADLRRWIRLTLPTRARKRSFSQSDRRCRPTHPRRYCSGRSALRAAAHRHGPQRSRDHSGSGVMMPHACGPMEYVGLVAEEGDGRMSTCACALGVRFENFSIPSSERRVL